MKKKVLSIILLLLFVLVLSGCCAHRQWQPATCETPETCMDCGKTKGEALGHIWLDATTEQPKTCSVCNATTGQRIITDPRFTTASTEAFQGNWVTHITVPGTLFGFEEFHESLSVRFLIQFHNDGSMGMDFTATNNQQFTTALAEYLYDSLYTEFAEDGMSQEEIDEAIVAAYGMTAEQYVATVTTGLDFDSIISMLNSVTGVYYVENDLFHTGISWDSHLESTAFTLNDDTLVLGKDFTGLTDEPLVFKRTAE